MKARTIFWLALGALVALAAMPSSLTAQVAPPAAAAKPPVASAHDLAFARFIALIRGHLLTGDELVSQRQWDTASQHISFPREEIYGIIRDDLRNYKTPPFDDALKALVRAVKAHNSPQVQKARARVEEALAAADAGLKAKVPNWPRFVVTVAVEVLKAAPDEFDDAVAKGRIVHPIGYQTARGFILQADRMIERVASEVTGDSATALSEVRAGFTPLKQAFASLNAPKQPTIDTAAVLSAVSKIEAAAGKLTEIAN